MFRYRNVIIASFTLFFFSTMVHLIYSCVTLPKDEVVYSLIFGGAFFAAPLIFTLTGKIKRTQPYVLVSFYALSSFVLSVINRSAFFNLPVLFAAAVVMCGFFLSSKLCLWYLMLTDAILIVNVLFFMPEDTGHLAMVYLAICVCYNISGLGMVLFVQAVENNHLFLRKQNKKISLKNRRNDEFWAASSEQMNSTVDKLSDICAELLSRTDLPVSARERLFKVQSETGRLSIMLSDAEDYALIESNSMRLKNEPYSFHSLLSDVANFCLATCPKPSVDIILDCQPDIPAVMIGDSRRITQIIMNLFANSVKFTESGSITISISSRNTAEGVNLRIMIKDTGTGITRSAEKRIFTVYAENNGEKPIVHLGLGVTKRLVSLMGGFIFMRNVKSGGSCFIVTIPQKAQNPQPFAAVPQREKLYVLLYLKSPLVAASAGEQLEKLGVKYDICRTRADFMLKKDDPKITHIFFDYCFYSFDKPIFDIMARIKAVSAVCGEGETETPLPKNIKRVLKPMHIALFSHIFNRGPSEADNFVQEFTAPDARILIVGDDTERLRALDAYNIQPTHIKADNIINELRENDYDIIFLCGNCQDTAAKVMVADDGMYMNIPVISVGENMEGCSDILSAGFSKTELNCILEKWLPDNIMLPIDSVLFKKPYSELNAMRGLASCGGSKSAYNEMLEIFEDRVREVLNVLKQTLDNNNFDLCAIQLSSLQSSSANIGAVSVAEITRQAHSAALRREGGLVRELTDLLEVKLNNLLNDIFQYCAENGIKSFSSEEIVKRSDIIRSSIEDGNCKIASEQILHILSGHIPSYCRVILKSAVTDINSGRYDKAADELYKLKEGARDND